MIRIWHLICSRLLINTRIYSSLPLGCLPFPRGWCCCQGQAHLTMASRSGSSNKLWVFLAPWFSGAQDNLPVSFWVSTDLPAALPLVLSDLYVSSCSFSRIQALCDLSWTCHPRPSPLPISGLLLQNPFCCRFFAKAMNNHLHLSLLLGFETKVDSLYKSKD